MKSLNKKFGVKIIKILMMTGVIFNLIAIQNGIVNVSARIDPIIFMEPNAAFGVVFPRETLEKEFYVKAVKGYQGLIPYRLTTQVKPRVGNTSEYCLNNSSDYEKCYPFLCPYLDILSADNEGDNKNNAVLNLAGDMLDRWKVVLNVPAIKNFVGQDFKATPVDSSGEYGCDIKLALAEDGGDTGSPAIKVEWEMNVERDFEGKYLGKDDSIEAGAQFLPPGRYNANKNIAVCAIVADPYSLANINEVYAGIFYPVNISTGPNHDASHAGCGKKMDDFVLAKMEKTVGYELFCDKIRNNNGNLPTFVSNYDYDKICARDGELMKETAAVYCGDKSLSYEDPSGDYKTLVMAQNREGFSGKIENDFTYLPLTSFETDFDSLDYGKVKLSTRKIIGGDLTFKKGDGKSTIRNTGNTRLSIIILQDDMGLGKNENIWNVRYDGRIGGEAAFENYLPYENKKLENILNLSETNAMDFSVDVSMFQGEKDTYTGIMNLNAVADAYLDCE